MTLAKQGFQAFYNSWHPEVMPSDYDKEQAYGPNLHGAPVVWHPAGVNYAWFYGMPEREYLKAFKAYDDGQVDEHPSMTTIEIGERSPDGMPGGFLALSANGGRNGIVWVSVARKQAADASTTRGQIMGRLIAFDALTLRKLWSDELDEGFMKFTPPTVASGKVFRVTYDADSQNSEIIVYGLGGSSVFS
jgi:outer membrane protein assembly factor BamB